MVDLNQFQQISWVIYNNLTDEIASPDNSFGDSQNYRELLQGFLRNEEFEMALLGAAEEYDPSQLPAITRNVSTAYQSPETMVGAQATHLVEAVAAGQLETLSTLIDGYDPASGHAAQIDAIELNDFGVTAFDDAVEAIDSDAYYHVIADPRYAEIQERYTELTGTKIDISSDVAEAKQFVADYPDPELAAEAEAFYAAYLESPDAYMSTAPENLENTAPEIPSQPLAADISNSNLSLPAQFAAVSIPSPATLTPVVNLDAVPTVQEETPTAPNVAPANEEVVMAAAVAPEDAAPAEATTDFVWNDDAIFATYDALSTSNPETIAGATDVTQEAYAAVQAVLKIETEIAQSNSNPAAYIANGNIPPTDANLAAAQDAAYEHLAGLSPQDALTVSVESVAVSDFDERFDNTPQTPAVAGGQEYLADAGLNATGTNTLAAEAAQRDANLGAMSTGGDHHPDETPSIEPTETNPAGLDLTAVNETFTAIYGTSIEDIPSAEFGTNEFDYMLAAIDVTATPENEIAIGRINQSINTLLNDNTADAIRFRSEVSADPQTFLANYSEFVAENPDPTSLQVHGFVNSAENLNYAPEQIEQDMALAEDIVTAAEASGVDISPGDLQTEAAFQNGLPTWEGVDSDVQPGTTSDDGTLELGTDIETDVIPFQAPAEPNTPPTETITGPFEGAAAEESNVAAVDSIYTIESGDNLWNIAEEQYGLTNAGDIMRAVDHIARMNGLENGTDANRIKAGDELDMPSAEQITKDVESLNWSALDAETQRNLSQGSYLDNDKIAAAPNFN